MNLFIISMINGINKQNAFKNDVIRINRALKRAKFIILKMSRGRKLQYSHLMFKY